MIAIDGVAPQAKMCQQRTRRFMSAHTEHLRKGIEKEVLSGISFLDPHILHLAHNHCIEAMTTSHKDPSQAPTMHAASPSVVAPCHCHEQACFPSQSVQDTHPLQVLLSSDTLPICPAGQTRDAGSSKEWDHHPSFDIF